MSAQAEEARSSALPLALLTACSDGNTEKVRLLLEQAARVDIVDQRNRSCLHVAAGRGHEDVLLEVLCAGADVRMTDFQGNSPLHYCSDRGCVKLLVQYGADIHCRNNIGVTPLEAMQRRQVDPSVIQFTRSLAEGTNPRGESLTLPRSASKVQITPSAAALQPLGTVRSLWEEFCRDIGTKNLVIVLFMCLLASLLVAYVITGYAQELNGPISVGSGSHMYTNEL